MRFYAVLSLVLLGLLGCGENLVQDRVQSTPGETIPKPRKPVHKFITPATTARLDFVALTEDSKSALGWKNSGEVRQRLVSDVECTLTGANSNELGIVVKDKNVMLVAILDGYRAPRFATHWRSNDKGTVTFSTEAPNAKEEVGPVDGTSCSVAAHSDLKRIEGTLRCARLEGEVNGKKVAYSLKLYFNCAPARP